MYKYYAPRKWKKIMVDAELKMAKAIHEDDSPIDSDDNSGVWVAVVMFLMFVIMASIDKV